MTLREPQRGMGSIGVNYSRSFFDIWTDVVKFVFFRAPGVRMIPRLLSTYP